MISLLILVFLVTLFYIAISGRMFVCIDLLRVQGLLLFGVALIQLKDINIFNLLVVLLETLVFKSIVIPYYFKRIIIKNNIAREVEPFVSGFTSLVIVSFLIILSFILSFYIRSSHLKITFLTAAFSAITTGLFIIITRKKLITHLIGYIMLENGIVLLSFSLGNDMPMMVNAGIFLDILISVMLFSLFVNKIGQVYKDMDIGQLNKLSD